MLTRFFRLIPFLLISLLAFPASAQESRALSYGDITFSTAGILPSNVNIVQSQGDPVEYGAGFSDAPYIQFLLYDAPPAPESLFERSGGIRVYSVSDFEAYPWNQEVVDALAELLESRADLSVYMSPEAEAPLPFLPIVPAGQVIRARASYLESDTLSGISYVTIYRHDLAPFLANEAIYTFQGLTNDGLYYVSAVFPLTTDVFPQAVPPTFDPVAFSEGFDAYVAESVVSLNASAPDDFTPTLTGLDDVILSLSINGG